MARVALPKVDTAGVYAHLRRYFEDDLHQWESNLSHTHATGAPFPRQRILDGLRAGQTVNVPVCALPQSAFEGAPIRPGPLIDYGPRRGQPSVIRPRRAVVAPDDRITFSDVDAMKLWLEENDL